MKWLRVAAAILAFVASSSFAASRIFFDSFDNTSQWASDGTRNRCNSVTSSADGGVGPHSGGSMLRCNWNGVVEWNDNASFEILNLPSLSYGTDLFFRFYLRPDNNAKDHPANGPKILRWGNNSFWAMNFRDGVANGQFYGPGPVQIGSTFWGGANNLSDGQWHKFEFYIHVASSGGIIRYWEDGVVRYEATNVNTTPEIGNWTIFHVSSNWSGAPGCCDHDATNYLYWDDFEIFTETGTGATGNLSDATVSAAGGSAPTVSAVTCSPSVIQSGNGSTTCSATYGNSPTSYAWTGARGCCSFGTPSASSTTYTCTCGGSDTVCVNATNGSGSSGATCTSSSVTYRYARPSNVSAN